MESKINKYMHKSFNPFKSRALLYSNFITIQTNRMNNSNRSIDNRVSISAKKIKKKQKTNKKKREKY